MIQTDTAACNSGLATPPSSILSSRTSVTKAFRIESFLFHKPPPPRLEWLRYQGIKAEMIYIDASHEEEDVYQDLREYWDLLRDGGVIFGDDYTWDGVRLAVDRFAREEKLPLTFVADKWILQKSPR